MNLSDFIKKNRLFRSVSILKLSKDFVEKQPAIYHKNQLIYGKGTPSDSIYLILSGKVNMIDYNFVNQDRRENISKTFVANDYFGFDEMDKNVNRLSTCISLEQSEILVISKSELERLIKDNPQIFESLKSKIPDNKITSGHHQDRIIPKQEKPTSVFDFRSNPAQTGTVSIQNTDTRRSESLANKETVINQEFKKEDPLQKELEKLRNREAELSRMEASLKKEKEFAEFALNKELSELSEKESQVSILEEALLKEEAQAQQLIRKKIEELRLQENELRAKNETLRKEKELVDQTLSKTKILAQKELELIKKAKELNVEKENASKIVSKEKELAKREKELEHKFRMINEEKIKIEDALRKELELKNKEAEIENKFSLLEQEKKKIEESLKKEKELKEKENLLNEKSLTLESEKTKVAEILKKEQELKWREQEIEKRIKELEIENSKQESNSTARENIKKHEEELRLKITELNEERGKIDKAKIKEDELLDREKQLRLLYESLNKEKKLSEQTLEQEIKNLEIRENEILQKEKNLELEKQFAEKSLEERLNEIEKTEANLMAERRALAQKEAGSTQKVEQELAEYKKREMELLKRIKELENKPAEKVESTLNPVREELKEEKIPEIKEQEETKIIKPVMVDNKKTDESKQADQKIIELEKKILFGRDFTHNIQKFEFNGIVIITVNIERGTANYAPEFKNSLDRVIREGAKKLIIDVSYCQFLDSTFLGVLVKYLKKIKYEGGDLRVIIDKEKSSSTMFFVSGMERVLKIFENIRDAVTNF